MDKNNLSIVRQQFAQCVFNHTIHEKAADRLRKHENRIKWWNIIFLWLDILFLILWIIKDNQILFYFSIAITAFEILFAFIKKEFSIEEVIQNHKKIAIQFLWLRWKYENLIVDIMNNSIKSNIISERRDLLQDQYQIICSLSPKTTKKDYETTQEDLLWKKNKGEDFTWSDDEINHFLPETLQI